ncbi:UNVERIFIED_CONTAM: hypothetical protein Slati_0856100 [Sesamum latifolium]|uniref:Uncharacterized protein n=1 Tax=Sesamum latifolium TaxID=2727402 RepID=A0AAW2XMN2_9LAMI
MKTRQLGGAVRKKGCNTRTSQGVTHPSTTLAQARLTSEFDGIRCISAGMIAPAEICAH